MRAEQQSKRLSTPPSSPYILCFLGSLLHAPGSGLQAWKHTWRSAMDQVMSALSHRGHGVCKHTCKWLLCVLFRTLSCLVCCCIVVL